MFKQVSRILLALVAIWLLAPQQSTVGATAHTVGATAHNNPNFTTTILRVDADSVAGAPDGSSWALAYPNLQDALIAAGTPGAGDDVEIWVADGVYYPDVGSSVTDNDRATTFQLKNSVAIYGGFNGSEANRTDRDWGTNDTILSGDIEQDDTNGDGNNIAETSADIQGNNAYQVTTGSGTNNTAILNGLTVTAGQANGTYVPPLCGPQCGGGMYNENGSPTVTNVSFAGNSAFGLFGGMGNFNSNPIVTNVTFVGNSATNGGGMGNFNNSSPTLTNVTFAGNSSDAGGGMINNNSSPTLTNVTFAGNSSTSTGGGMFNASNSNPIIQNSIFWNNKDNTGTGTATASIYNNVSTPIISYSLVQGQNPAGTGNLDGTDVNNDPDFVQTVDPNTAPTSAGNLRLQTGSPAIDVGNNAVVTAATDLGGITRILDGDGNASAIVDMGAYEFATCPSSNILYVNVNVGGGSNDGTNWTNAFASLQDGLAQVPLCPAVDQIWLAQGVYYPDVGSGVADNDHAATFQLQDDLAIYGGFAGSETALDQRDWDTNVTILSGDIEQDDTNSDGNNIAETSADIQGDNAYQVTTGSGTNNSAILDGVTVTAGQANGTYPQNYGGGMYNNSGSPTLTNVTFVGNSADGLGGGMFNESSSPTLINVSFASNSSDQGGGMYNNLNSSPTLTNATFAGNSARHGGGMFNNLNSSPTLTNVTFAGNSARLGGGGIDNETGSNPVIQNSIFWNNKDITGTVTATASIFNSSSTPTISYSLVQGQNPAGTGNLDGTDANNDPDFVQTVDPNTAPTSVGNLRLQTGSPAIDVGNNVVVTALTDLGGITRIIDGDATATATVDMGAYEFVPGPGGVNGAGNLTLWLNPDAYTDINCTTAATDGQAVACWRDKSGYAHNATQTPGTAQPSYQATVASLNNQAAIRFDGQADANGDFLNIPPAVIDGANDFTFFAVMDWDGGSNWQRLWDFGNGTTDVYGFVSPNNGLNNVPRFGIKKTGVAEDAPLDWGTALPANSAQLLGMQWASGGNGQGYWQGASSGTVAVASTPQDLGSIVHNYIGKSVWPDPYLAGDIAEFIVYQTALSNVERTHVELYLAHKYDLPLTAAGIYSSGAHNQDVDGISESAGISTSRDIGGLVVTDNDFLQETDDALVLGHNNLTGNSPDDLPAALEPNGQRWQRAWDCTVYDDLSNGGNVEMVFDFDDAGMGANTAPAGLLTNYVILHRAGTSGDFTVLVDGATSIDGTAKTVTFSTVPVTGLCSQITLGTKDAAASPTALALVQTDVDGGTGLGNLIILIVILTLLGGITLYTYKRPIYRRGAM